MESIISLLTSLSSMSPLAVIALLGTIIYMLVKGKTAVDGKVATVASNHLHGLPDMSDTLNQLSTSVQQMTLTLQRIEVTMAEGFTHIKARLNGK